MEILLINEKKMKGKGETKRGKENDEKEREVRKACYIRKTSEREDKGKTGTEDSEQ